MLLIVLLLGCCFANSCAALQTCTYDDNVKCFDETCGIPIGFPDDPCACTEQDIGVKMTNCPSDSPTMTHDLVYFWRPPAKCVSSSIRLPQGVSGVPCDIICGKGTFLNVSKLDDPTVMSSTNRNELVCDQCRPGTESQGDAHRWEVWRHAWPAQFSTFCTTGNLKATCPPWRLLGDEIDSGVQQGDYLLSALVLNAELVMDGKLSFLVWVESSKPSFVLSVNGWLRYISSSTSGQWRRVDVDLVKGPVSIHWQYFKDHQEVFGEDRVRIRWIEISGVSYGDVECRPCESGYHASSKGTDRCLECPEGTYQPAYGASECITCPNGTTSLAGSTTCHTTSPCTPWDYGYLIQACSDQNTASKSYRWLQPKVCAGGTPLPLDEQVECNERQCNAGWKYDQVAEQCKPCNIELGYVGSNGVTCSACQNGEGPYPLDGKVVLGPPFVSWPELGMTTDCEPETQCVNGAGWRLGHEFMDSGSSNGPLAQTRARLRLDTQGVTHITVWYELACTAPSYFTIDVDDFEAVRLDCPEECPSDGGPTSRSAPSVFGGHASPPSALGDTSPSSSIPSLLPSISTNDRYFSVGEHPAPMLVAENAPSADARLSSPPPSSASTSSPPRSPPRQHVLQHQKVTVSLPPHTTYVDLVFHTNGANATGCDRARIHRIEVDGISGLSGPRIADECRPCPAGTHAAPMGHGKCTPCAPGTAQSDDGQITCDQCQPQTYSGSGWTSCEPCGSGTHPTDKADACAFNCSALELLTSDTKVYHKRARTGSNRSSARGHLSGLSAGDGDGAALQTSAVEKQQPRQGQGEEDAVDTHTFDLSASSNQALGPLLLYIATANSRGAKEGSPHNRRGNWTARVVDSPGFGDQSAIGGDERAYVVHAYSFYFSLCEKMDLHRLCNPSASSSAVQNSARVFACMKNEETGQAESLGDHIAFNILRMSPRPSHPRNTRDDSNDDAVPPEGLRVDYTTGGRLAELNTQQEGELLPFSQCDLRMDMLCQTEATEPKMPKLHDFTYSNSSCFFEWRWETPLACRECVPSDFKREWTSCVSGVQYDEYVLKDGRACIGDAPEATSRSCSEVEVSYYVLFLLLVIPCCVLAAAGIAVAVLLYRHQRLYSEYQILSTDVGDELDMSTLGDGVGDEDAYDNFDGSYDQPEMVVGDPHDSGLDLSTDSSAEEIDPL